MAVRGWLAQELLRHASRRSDGMTTVSVLVGDPQRMLQLFDADTVLSAACDAREMARDVLARLDPIKLRGDALRTLVPDANVVSEWQRRSERERALWLERLQAHTMASGPACAWRWLQLLQQGQRSEPVAELALLAPWRALPILALQAPQAVRAVALAQAVRLAREVQALQLVFLVEPSALPKLLAAQTSRDRALLQDALIREPAQTEPGPIQNTSPQQAEQALHALREAAKTSLEAARKETTRARREEATDRARSLAERFLYELLQSSPVTRDVFELNVRLPFQFGARDLEADLASRSLRIALEVDGYHHFKDPDAYRRDRRKDLIYQKHDYVVARWLAEDVVDRCEQVRADIERLVASHRELSRRQEKD
jgi:very-short-patch-repair endonuclease